MTSDEADVLQSIKGFTKKILCNIFAKTHAEQFQAFTKVQVDIRKIIIHGSGPFIIDKKIIAKNDEWIQGEKV